MGEITWPTGFSQRDLVGWGNFGFVCLDLSTDTVIKSPHLDEHKKHIQIESAIYKRFEDRGSHVGLLRYFGPYESGIRLQFAENYGLRKYILDHGRDLSLEQRLRWCQQIADALAYIHSSGVIHGDLEVGNVFLDGNLNAKVADFAGSSLDGSPLLVAVTNSHRYPGPLLSKQADIFALGSTIFEVMCGRAPYDGSTGKDITDFFKESKYPETKSLGPIGDIIMGCWQALRSAGSRPPISLLLAQVSVSTIAISAFGLLVISWAARSWVARSVH
ncbi:kinase-like protein [Periconia macrospinosa]|uniref:Kinase-like protein n=1 Tax=Periconia macrospinosa TaxID=97972 RepID=A0A2V1CYK7_9PLEO|nr:kinase-like protein [Periconia macrospinosa]